MSSSGSNGATESSRSDSDVETGDLKTNILLMLAEREAARAREHVQMLQRANDRLVIEIKAICERLNDAEARAQAATDSHDLVRELKTMLAAEQKEKEQIIQEKELLAAGTEQTENLKLTIENQDRKIENLEQKLTIVRDDRNWCRVEYNQMLETRNTQNGNQAPEIEGLKSEITKLKSEVKAVKEESRNKVQKLKREIAFQVMHLDLFDIRIYTCRHNNLSNIRADTTVTRESNAFAAGKQIFRDWEADAEFMAEYVAARQHILTHHVAHERTGMGRGKSSAYVKDLLDRGDESRGVRFNYILS